MKARDHHLRYVVGRSQDESARHRRHCERDETVVYRPSRIRVVAALIDWRCIGTSWAEGDEALRTVIDAYVYAYPRVLMDVEAVHRKDDGCEERVPSRTCFFKGRLAEAIEIVVYSVRTSPREKTIDAD